MCVQYTDTSSIAPFGAHNKIAKLILYEVNNFVGIDIDFHGIQNFDKRVWVADGPTVVGNNVWNLLLGDAYLGNTAKFVTSFFF